MKKFYLWSSAVVIVIAALIAYNVFAPRAPGQYDDFANCLSEQGVKFYGAYWCPHCQRQKNNFGDSKDLLPYIECSLPGGNGQTTECREANIQSYPTWEFPDGTRLTGEQPMQILSERSSCPIVPSGTE